MIEVMTVVFRSKIHNRILPQMEHSRLAGMLAWHWGNEAFDRPAIDFASFARGVTLHDWHYGMLDNSPLGETSRKQWMAIARAGVDMTYDDPVTDIVTKYHLRRLIGEPGDGEVAALLGRLEDRISQRMAETSGKPADFAWADRITRLCDSIAFDFGFTHIGGQTRPVCPRRGSMETTDLTYEITSGSSIYLTPWPFSVASFSEQVITFAREGYPDRLEPVVVQVTVAQDRRAP